MLGVMETNMANRDATAMIAIEPLLYRITIEDWIKKRQ
jgi:hypothetical protein